MTGQRYSVHERREAGVSMWQELLVGFELVQLRLTSIFYGLGVPHGHGEAVVLIPGFLGTDAYLGEMFSWLRTVGYRSYFSGIGWNAECPNLLIRRRLNETVKRAYQATGRRVHLVGPIEMDLDLLQFPGCTMMQTRLLQISSGIAFVKKGAIIRSGLKRETASHSRESFPVWSSTATS